MVAVGALFIESAPADPATAGVFFRQAAELSDPEAAFALGQLYLHGLGVAAEAEEALTWFKLAADHGMPAACERLGALMAMASAPSAISPPPPSGSNAGPPGAMSPRC